MNFYIDIDVKHTNEEFERDNKFYPVETVEQFEKHMKQFIKQYFDDRSTLETAYFSLTCDDTGKVIKEYKATRTKTIEL